jgi:putative aldouronate transport system substrate-binding protein
MKRAKIICLALVLLSAGSLLFDGAGKQSATGVPASSYTGDLPFVTLKYYNVGQKSPDHDMVIEKLNEELRNRLNCEIAIEYMSWADYQQKYQLVFASGEQFDAIVSASWMDYAGMAVKNAFLELKPEFIRQYAPYIADLIPQDGWDQTKINGKMYMLLQSTREYNHYLVEIRGDLREKYGLPPIETYDDLERYLAAVKKNNPELIPLSLGAVGSISNWMYLWNLTHDRYRVGESYIQLYYVDYKNPNKILNFFEQPDAKDFITMMNRWQKAGYWSRNVLSSTEDSTADFTNGLAAACIGASINLEGCYQRDLIENDGAWKVEFYDLTSKGKNKVPPYPYINAGSSLNRNAKNPERWLMAMDLLRKDRDLNNLVTYGLQGVHWEYESDGTTVKGIPVPPENGYGDSLQWIVRNINYQVPYTEKSSPWFRNNFDEVVSRAVTLPVSGFLFTDTNVRNEVAALADVFQQYAFPLICGFTDPSELPAVVQRMKTAGIDTIIAEMQKQLDNY